MPKRGSTSESAHRRETLASLRTALDILVRLENGAECSVRSLADELGLSARQTGRYLNVLEDFGIGFESDGNGNRRTPLKLTTVKRNPPFNALFLTREELLLLYAHLAGLHHAGDAEVRARLWEKVRRNLGVEPIDGPRLETTLGTFDKAYKAYDEKRKIIADLLAALYADQTCQVTYRTPDGEEPRTYKIEPYELIEHDGGLYLYCRVPRYDSVILLAVERIQTLSRNDETFARQKNVAAEIAEKQRRAFRILDDGEELTVTLRFSPKVAFYIAERTWHPTQKLTEHKDGSLTMTFTASGRPEIERWIRGWGEDVEVVSVEGPLEAQ